MPGNRAHEFELRLKGASYEDIAKAGGGIVSTVRATRAASGPELQALAQKRLSRWLTEGTAVIEVKSGYGLDRDTELKMLRAARQLAGLTVRTTFLGAHTVPEEYKGHADRYIDFVCEEVLPAAAKESSWTRSTRSASASPSTGPRRRGSSRRRKNWAFR